MVAKTREKKRAFRIPITAVLLVLGGSLIFLILAFGAINPRTHLAAPLYFPIGIVLLALFVILLIKYKKDQTSEEKAKRINIKSLAGTIILLLLMIIMIFLGISFSINLSINFPLSGEAEQVQFNRILLTSLVLYFSFLPFIMALWYKTSPGLAVRLIVRLRKLFNLKTKTKIAEIMVLETPQDHSFIITLERAFSAMIYSLFTVYFIYYPLSNFIQQRNPNLPLVGFPEDIHGPINVTSQAFINYCSIYLFNFVVPLIASFILFFWLLPPAYLLDDAGVVCFKRYLNRRVPGEIKSISNWFLSLVTSIVGTSAIFSYIYFIQDNLNIISAVAKQMGVFPAVEFSFFILGFPVFGTILMAFMLLLFQESQYNKLKTFVYQELVNIKIDPRIGKIKLERKGQFQERTLMNYLGENLSHNPPLNDSVDKFPPTGELDEKDLVKK